VLLAVGDALADSTNDIAGRANTDANLAFFIADDNDGSKAHLLAALDGFGHAADLNHAFLPFGITLLAAAITASATPFAAITAASTALFLLLPFGCGRNISSAWNGVGVCLRRISHGESRDQN
jgi:hypothetical protein